MKEELIARIQELKSTIETPYQSEAIKKEASRKLEFLMKLFEALYV